MILTIFAFISLAWSQNYSHVDDYLEALEYRQYLKPFHTDGCSMFPEEQFDNSKALQSCCVEHDIKYWAGGTRQQRKLADKTLKACVAIAHSKELASIMYNAVRLGGKPNKKNGYRWGYGWPYLRPYGKLSDEERQQVNQLTPKERQHLPILERRLNLPTFPTFFGNYCVDSAFLYILEYIENTPHINSIRNFQWGRGLELKTQSCPEGIRFYYHNGSTNCADVPLSKVLPKYFSQVVVPKNCQ